MKCPSCGYFNVPGAQACGSCGRALGDKSAPASWDEVLPPRARDRSARQHAEAAIGAKRAATLRHVEGAARQIAQDDWARTQQRAQSRGSFWKRNFSRAGLQLNAQRWLPPVLSLLPGAGQLLLNERLKAFALLTIGMPLVAYGFWHTFEVTETTIITRGPDLLLPTRIVSAWLGLNVPMWLAMLAMWVSVWDAALASMPRVEDTYGQRLRRWRLGLLSAMIVSLAVLAALGLRQLL